MAQDVLAADLVVEQVEAESRLRLRLEIELPLKSPDLSGVCRLIANHRSSPSSKAHQKSGSFPPPALPGLSGTMTLSDSRPGRRLCNDVEAATPAPDAGLPRLPESPSQRAVPITPADRNGCTCRLLPHPARPSPLFRRVGVHDFTFEACSGFTRVTARRIAQPPKAAFVTRLRPGRSPSQAARQLPDLPTTLWVEPSSTGDPRRRGALRKAG